MESDDEIISIFLNLNISSLDYRMGSENLKILTILEILVNLEYILFLAKCLSAHFSMLQKLKFFKLRHFFTLG